MFEERVRTRYQFLTKNQKKIAEFLLSRGAEAAFLSLSDLAGIMKTSTSNVFRFAKSIGYEGYPDLQNDLQKKIKEKLSPVRNLESNQAKGIKEDIYATLFDRDEANLRETRAANNIKTLNLVVSKIVEARKVGFVGYRTSQGIALMLSFLLGRIRENCEVIQDSFGELTNQLVPYGPKDVLLGISFPRYGRQTLEILKHGKKKGCTIISITDNPISPAGQISDMVLIASNKSSSYFNSFTSAVTLVNCLVAGVSLKSKGALAFLKSVEQIDNEWGVFLR